MKKKRSIMISRTKNLLYTNAESKYQYVNHQRTDVLENVVVDATCPDIEVKILLPPKEELLNIVQSRFQFGDRFVLDDVFDVEDIQVSIYNDALTVKIYATLKEVTK